MELASNILKKAALYEKELEQYKKNNPYTFATPTTKEVKQQIKN
jgi:hypothetical protein